MSTFKVRGVLEVQGVLQNAISFSEVNTWLNNLSTRGLPRPDNTVITALNTLIAGLYTNNLRSKIKRLNLFCGGDYISSLFPIIRDLGNTWDYNGIFGNTVASLSSGPFQASDWSLTTGFNASTNASLVVAGNITGTTNTNTIKIIDSTVSANTLGGYNAHMCCYISADSIANTITTNTDLGVATGAENFNLQAALGGNTSNISRYNCYFQDAASTAGGTLNTNFTTSRGFYIGSRVSQTLSTMYKNSSIFAVKGGSLNPNTSLATTATLDAGTIGVFGRFTSTNAPGVNKGVNNATDRTMYMYSLGTGLTDTEVATYNTLINSFNTAIGRTNYTTY